MVKRLILVGIGFVTFIVIIVVVYNKLLVEPNLTIHNSNLSQFCTGIPSISKDTKCPAILLIHGLGGSPIDLLPLSYELKKKGYLVHSLVLPAHCTYPKDLESVDSDDWINASLAALDSLQHQCQQIVVVGFSMGGTLGLSLASRRDVDKLILINPYFKLKNRCFLPDKWAIWAGYLSKLIPFIKKFKIGQINDPNGLKGYDSYKYVSLKSVSELEKTVDNAIEEFEKVQSDVLWIHTVKDRIADYDRSKEKFDDLSVDKKRFIKYELSNHIILHDYESDDVIDNVLEFIETEN